jgi:hypothetical protein
MAAGTTGAAHGMVALVGGSGVACHIYGKQNGSAHSINLLAIHRNRNTDIKALIIVVHRIRAIAKTLILFVHDLLALYLQIFQSKGIGVKTQDVRHMYISFTFR